MVQQTSATREHRHDAGDELHDGKDREEHDLEPQDGGVNPDEKGVDHGRPPFIAPTGSGRRLLVQNITIPFPTKRIARLIPLHARGRGRNASG